MPAINLVAAARDTAYEPILENFDAVGVNISDPNTVLVKRDDDRFNTISDLVEYAKQKPGELVLGADGPLSDDQLAVYKIEQATGAKFTYVPYDGGAPSAKALMGGETDVLITNCFDVLKFEEHLRALAVLWPERYPLIPDVPTFKEEMGIQLVGASTRGVAAPAGVPSGALAKLKQAFYAATSNPEYIKEAKNRGLTLIEPRIGGDFAKMIEDEEESVVELLDFFVEGGYL
jgi:tripartite-type tricarboxylate transporter receptor subunit TctC